MISYFETAMSNEFRDLTKDDIFSQIKKLISDRLEEANLLLDKEEFNDYCSKREEIGNRLIQKIRNKISHLNIRNLEIVRLSFPSMLFSGYTYGMIISELLDINENNRADAAWNNALAYSLAVILDVILDNNPYLFDSLGTVLCVIFIETLRKSKEICKIIKKDVNYDEKVVVIYEIISKMFKNNITDLLKKTDSKIRNEYLKIFDETLQSELLKGKGLGNFPTIDEIYDYLRNRNTLMFWWMALICIAYNPSKKIISNLSKWKKFILTFGDIIWLIDDLADLVEDIHNSEWNIVIIRILKEEGLIFDKKELGPDNLKKLIEIMNKHDILDLMIDELLSKLNYIKKYCDFIGKSSEDILELLKFFFSLNFI